jgi:hypothetical protein
MLDKLNVNGKHKWNNIYWGEKHFIIPLFFTTDFICTRPITLREFYGKNSNEHDGKILFSFVKLNFRASYLLPKLVLL